MGTTILSVRVSPVDSLNAYDTSQAVLPPRPDLNAIDFNIHNDAASRDALAATNELEPQNLSDRDVAAIIAFLHALTDPAALEKWHGIPISVPSGLPLLD